MNGSGSGGGKGFGHRYLGPEHVLLGLLVQARALAAT
jgi:Clp amino terminal domain, pathogenicity island component